MAVWMEWIWTGFLDGVMKVVSLWWVIPLFVGIQLMKDRGWLDKVSHWLRPVLAPLRLPGDAGLPVAAGLAVGLTYGAGVIIQAAEEGKLKRDELTVTCIFVGISHALIEETLLFSTAGTSGLLLLVIRVLTALVFGLIASRLLLKRRQPEGA